jgi:uncharacterized membrane protein (TIGR02234 family)
MAEPRPVAAPPAAARSGARAYGLTLVGGLVSAAAVSVGMSRPWVNATADVAGLPVIHGSVDGADVAPLAGALGFVLLAAVGAVIATRGWVRRGLGVLVVGCAAVVLAAAVHPGATSSALEQSLSAKGWSGGPYDATVSAWRGLAGAGALGCLLTGALLARFGGSWPSMGARYDAPGTAPPSDAYPQAQPTETDLWRSIDSGHDPTQGP